jgi:hypothetical protein
LSSKVLPSPFSLLHWEPEVHLQSDFFTKYLVCFSLHLQ